MATLKSFQSPKLLAFCLAWLFFCSKTGAQTPVFILSGRVLEASTGDVLPGATVRFLRSNEGAVTDTAGFFKIKTAALPDSLVATMVGFVPCVLPIDPNHLTELDFRLFDNTALLSEAVVTADADPGKKLMKKVLAHKPENDPARLPRWSAGLWNRTELDLLNVREGEPGGQKLRARMQEVFNSMDTANAGQRLLPVYFSEKIGRRERAGAGESDNFTAKKSLGLETDRLTRRLDKFNFRFNIYDNWFFLLQKTFAAPVSDGGLNFYKYFIEDTLSMGGERVFKIQFVPRRSRENAFSGFLWVDDSTFAVRRFEMHLAHDARLNFVDSIGVVGEFERTPLADGRKIYLPTRYEAFVRFEGGMELLGIPVTTRPDALRLACRSTEVLHDWDFGENGRAVAARPSLFDQTSTVQDEAFWEKKRPDTLTRHERAIYSMIDTMRQTPRFRRAAKLAAFVGTGMWAFDDRWRIGSYPNFVSSNSTEGLRVRLDFETLPKMNDRHGAWASIAYGVGDRRLKGTLKLHRIGSTAPWSKTTLTLRSDLDHSMADDEKDNDNIISTAFQKNLPPIRTYVKELKIGQEQQLGKYLMNTTSLAWREYDPVFKFAYRSEGWTWASGDTAAASLHRLPVTEFSTRFRWSPGEQAYRYNFSRITRTGRQPEVSVGYTFGFETGGTQFRYHKITAGISQNLKLPPKSTFFYDLSVGKTIGTLPYLLLDVPRGNLYYVASRYAFNTMQPYEFVSDRFASLHTRLSGGGILFDRVPFFEKLGWRERLSFNAFWGGISQKNRDFNVGSKFLVTGAKPFMEAGIGVENIFRVLSVEYIRRLDYRVPGVPNSGFFAGVTLNF